MRPACRYITCMFWVPRASHDSSASGKSVCLYFLYFLCGRRSLIGSVTLTFRGSDSDLKSTCDAKLGREQGYRSVTGAETLGS